MFHYIRLYNLMIIINRYVRSAKWFGAPENDEHSVSSPPKNVTFSFCVCLVFSIFFRCVSLLRSEHRRGTLIKRNALSDRLRHVVLCVCVRSARRIRNEKRKSVVGEHEWNEAFIIRHLLYAPHACVIYRTQHSSTSMYAAWMGWRKTAVY